MSLQVWLPLTKDLRQQGLSNVTVTNTGVTFSTTEGKLGGAAYFNGSSRLQLPLPSIMTTIKNTTVAAWVKSTSSTLALGGISHNSTPDYYMPECTLYSSGWQTGTGSGWAYVSGGTVANTNTWHHVACVIDDINVTTYLDGVQVTTKTLAAWGMTSFNLGSGHFIEVGSDFPGGDEYLTGYVNDFRIYNHALSLMEVKELAKGLVLHYPLNRQGWGQENLLTSGYRDITTWDRTAQGVWNITHNNESNTVVLVSTASWEHLYKLLPITFETGAQYTLSCRYKVLQNYNRWSSPYSVGLSLNASNPGSGNAQYPTDIIIPFGSVATEYIEGEITFTATTTTYYLDINGGYIADGSQNIGFEITNIKLEKGAKKTPWCPNSSDTLATTMGLNGTTEYDCSGFCNNGIKFGALTYESNTPKYNVSTHFNGTTSTYIQMPTITLDWGHITFTAWCKWDAFNSWSRIFDFGNGVNGADWDICLANYSTTSNPGLGGRTGSGASWPDTQVTEISLTSGQWIHLVETIEGKTCKLYANGVLKKTITLTNSPTITTMTLNYLGKSNWSNGPFNGNISDFRVYTTVFSVEDVKSLYQNSAYIDSSGNVYGAVHTEV